MSVAQFRIEYGFCDCPAVLQVGFTACFSTLCEAHFGAQQQLAGHATDFIFAIFYIFSLE